MDAIVERCCGLDVHRDTVVACLLTGNLEDRPKKEIRTFSTMSKGLQELLAWLEEAQCTHVAMESTGIYWKPVYFVLEGSFELKLANAQRIKNVPGRKTDVADAEWIAKLLRAGLIEGSFVPPQEIRELRELTRYRKKLVGNATAEKNRIQKVLETAGIKLSSVISDVFGVTGRSILRQLIEKGSLDVATLQALAKGPIRKKISQLVDALHSRLTVHHRFLLRQSWDHLLYIERSIEQMDEAIQRQLAAYQEEMELLQTIPGINQLAASAILAEIGPDMTQFASERHIASWAGVSPGNNESAGKKSPHAPLMETRTSKPS